MNTTHPHTSSLRILSSRRLELEAEKGLGFREASCFFRAEAALGL